jgi:phosphoinositide-3-kinase regulatory subunit 4
MCAATNRNQQQHVKSTMHDNSQLDCVVQVWDIRRLERDVSFASRLTYAGQSGRITSVCPVLDGASVASASSSGSLHVWRVEYSSKPGGWAPDKYRGATAWLGA